jgi:hypothetical protein
MFHPFRPIRSGSAPVALAILLALAAAPANAQTQIDSAHQAQKLRAPGQPGSAPLAPPPALPGAASRPDQAIPADRAVADMSPNDLLFDAINRGDAGDAREALARGADLGARNVLGMTPVELSVDIGRNDITFLLLSQRGASGSGGGRRTATAGAPAAHAAKAAPAPAARRASGVTLAAAQAPAASAPKRPAISSNPGTPAPQAGFLGFGAAPQQ